MAKTQEAKKKGKFVESLTAFLAGKKIILIVLLVLIVGLLVVLGITDNLKEKRLDASARALDLLEERYRNDWYYASFSQTGTDEAGEEARKAEIKEDLVRQGEAIADDYPGYYAAQKALMLLGNIHFETEDWDKAAGYYLRLVEETAAGSYMVPVALGRAAAAKEEAGLKEEALELFRRIVDDYGDTLYESLRAAFNAGRICEELGRPAEAVAAYDWIVEKAPGNNAWMYLAESRLLMLE